MASIFRTITLIILGMLENCDLIKRTQAFYRRLFASASAPMLQSRPVLYDTISVTDVVTSLAVWLAALTH